MMCKLFLSFFKLTFAFQVIQKIGLCISFYDLLESSDGLIGHGTGLVNVNGKRYSCRLVRSKIGADLASVKFRMIVFRPFKGEIMLGKISSGTEHGIKSTSQIPLQCIARANNGTVGLEFFNDILIPPPMLMENSRL
jgi:DNA-directed RNA polymerase III subunit RPC8